MLTITLDEAYVFDILSIYEVKIDKSTGDKKEALLQSHRALMEEITHQIGTDVFNQVIASELYVDLKNANNKVFDLVDRANESELAKETADANYERFIKKTELQTRFFKNKLSEVKI